MSAVMLPAPPARGALTECPGCGAFAPGQWFPASGVCVRCENARVRAKAMALECDQLAHAIALDEAVARLQQMAPLTPDGWYDVSFALAVSGPESAKLERSVRYLLDRGCLAQHQHFDGLYMGIPQYRAEAGR
jgi:hypothetical protein